MAPGHLPRGHTIMRNTHEFNGEYYELKKTDDTFRYAALGAVAGSLVGAAAVVLWSNPNVRSKVQQTMKESGNELKKSIFSDTNRKIVLDAFYRSVDDIKSGIGEFLARSMEATPTKKIK